MESSQSYSKDITPKRNMLIDKLIKIIQNLNWPTSRGQEPCKSHFKPKYLLDYKALKIINDITLLLITPNGQERKQILMMLNLAVQQSL